MFDAISHRGANALRVTTGNLPHLALTARPTTASTPLVIDLDGLQVGHETTVWWRRPIAPVATTEQIDSDELRLIEDETAAILPGVLEAADVRWVDAPWTIARARLKVLQLAVAASLGVAVPDSVVTSDPQTAHAFANAGPIVAKAASSGFGIAPYVAEVPPGQLSRVAACPTLLQRMEFAAADIRIVTIGTDSYSWIRQRSRNDTIDWRASDPSGAKFRPTNDDPTAGSATKIAERLGLTFSVQDWLATTRGCVFLEVNVQGQWLFLQDAHTILVDPLATHLLQ